MTKAFNIRIVFKVLGALMVIEALFMLLPTLVSWYYHEADLAAFVFSTLITLICGLMGVLAGRDAEKHIGEREGYFIVGVVWIVFSLFGMLPYYLSGDIPNFTDAFFETMSGFTTTGSTILANVESQTHAVLFWRALTQWLGGMGIIVLSIAILPMFGLGGMQLYAAEVPGVSYEKLSPRIADTSKLLWSVYIIFTTVETLLLKLFGMNWFDAVCHSFSTISTGGFSTRNNSLMDASIPIQYTVCMFMLLSGISFVMLIYAMRGKPRMLFKDEETRWYLSATGIATLVVSIGLFISHYAHTWAGAEASFRNGLFTMVSAITGTGFSVSNYLDWIPFLWVLVFFCMFTGACAGSTSGGIKWVRLIIFSKNGFAELKRRIHPNAIIPTKINGKPMTQATINNVTAFLFFYILITILSTIVICSCGIPFDEAIGSTVSSIGNVGISIGQFGPLGNFSDFPVVGKWVLSFVMLIGRLELFTILLMFSPALWKK